MFFQLFKKEERIKMEYWAEAQKTVINADENADLELPFKIISNNTTIPIIWANQKDSIINTINIDETITSDRTKIASLLLQLKNQNNPIKIEYDPGKVQYLYYGNSSLLNQLKYFPIALLLIILLFGALVYNYYKSTKMATQNKLWAGMAKETAHQIGTPLSSLMGWLEIMKASEIETSICTEIEKDIIRLQNITDRFSKIGSEPILELKDIGIETQLTFDYLQARISKQVSFSIAIPKTKLIVPINASLHSWTIENLVKNAIDAMKGKGDLRVKIEEEDAFVKISISDTGSGMPKKLFKQIFEPGFTTKKRGWGLGLSLTKRIVEDYHKGKIKVLSSEIGKGTTIQISYRKSN